jgi:hypothetical protein
MGTMKPTADFAHYLWAILLLATMAALGCLHLKYKKASFEQGFKAGCQEVLKGSLPGDTVFVTDFGEKYHTNPKCRGLRKATSTLNKKQWCKLCKRDWAAATLQAYEKLAGCESSGSED